MTDMEILYNALTVIAGYRPTRKWKIYSDGRTVRLEL